MPKTMYTTYRTTKRSYTDRFPRTLQEAFGPYAELHVDRRSLFARAIPWLITIMVALLIGLVSWVLQ